MILYHVTPDIKSYKKTFVPRIPEKTMPGEDKSIPRVCFSESIVGALRAIYYNPYTVEKFGREIAVYEIDTDDIDPKFLKNWQELYDTQLVPDANLTKEWWVMCEIKAVAKVYEVISYKRFYAYYCLLETYREKCLTAIKKYLIKNQLDSEISMEQISKLKNYEIANDFLPKLVGKRSLSRPFKVYRRRLIDSESFEIERREDSEKRLKEQAV